MSNKRRTLMAAAGTGGEGLYVEDVFSTFVFTANGQTGQTITNGIDLSGEGGMVWHKDRAATYGHVVWDTVRGDSVILSTNANTGNTTKTMTGDGTGQIAFKANGYDLKWDTGNEGTNKTVGWTFRKAPGFFDVVEYTGNGANRTIAHNLGSVPGMIIVKKTSASDSWYVYHKGIGATKYILLNSTGATDTSSTRWNDTAPTSTVFSLGTADQVNGDTATFVAYLFADDAQEFGAGSDESIIQCGIYTGNDSADGPEIDLGWEPQWLMLKGVGGSDWLIADTMRGLPVGSDGTRLNANLSNVEYTNNEFAAPQASGFQLTNSSFFNDGPNTYIYVAIRRPMKVPEAATEVFKPQLRTGSGAEVVTGAGFVPDVFYNHDRTYGGSGGLFDRLRGRGILQTQITNAENATSPAIYDLVGLDQMDGVELGGAYNINMTGSSRPFIDYFFKRAPKFFDVVAWTGTSSNAYPHAEAGDTLTHNLGVVPEMMILRRRDLGANWKVYHKDSHADPEDYALELNENGAVSSNNDNFNRTAPTSTQFTAGNNNSASGAEYIAYLFATLEGISKVGTYTADESLTTIDCGFAAGARFILIKRIDASGDWYLWDSARGIVSGNDPYTLVNTGVTETTGTDYIDPHNDGFQITAAGSSTINIDTGEYIFLAIA